MINSVCVLHINDISSYYFFLHLYYYIKKWEKCDQRKELALPSASDSLPSDCDGKHERTGNEAIGVADGWTRLFEPNLERNEK